MRIQEKGGIFLIVNFVLFFTVPVTGSQIKWEEQEPLLAYLMELGVINHEKAELLRGDCMLDWLHSKKNGQVLGLELILERSTYSDKLLSSRASRLNFYEALDALINQVDQVLEDCAREKKKKLSDASEDAYSDFCLTRYYSFLFNHRCSSARRALAQTSGEAPALSPILVPTPAPSFPIAPHEIPASPPLLIFPPDFGKSSDIASGEHSSNQRASNRTVIIVVVVTATVTIVIAAFFFLFCRRCCPFGSPRGKNDERPLLSISLGHQSTAESQKSFRLGSQVDEEKFGDQSFHNKVNHNKVSENLYVESHYVSNSMIEIPVATTVVSAAISAKNSLEMPPRLWDKPVLPPLKPPPGRAEPFKPPVGNAASLPPPPSRLISSPLLKPSPSVSNAPLDRPKPPPPSIPGPIKPSPVGTMVPPLPPPPTPGVNLVPPRAPPPPPTPGVNLVPPRAPPPPPTPGVNLVPPHAPPPPGAGVARPVPPTPPVVGAPPPPPRPPVIGLKPPRVVPPGQHPPASSISTGEVADGTAKAKLKPFFWDKVLANPDHSMVWHQIKSGSFQFNEEMIETLFGYAPAEKNKNEGKKEFSPQDGSPYIRLIDPKKAQNLSILLKALNVTTEEVYDALVKGHELPPELIQTLMKMAPTTEEELKLRLYAGELSQLGPAERFLKVLVDIPFAFKRLESLLFMCTLEEDMSLLKESFAVLEAACTELRESRLFLKLLEAVLKTGNRMNDGTFRGGAQAFKLDTLLKLSDVKGTDGKITLLHFVVEEIIRSEGKRAARDAKATSSTSSFKSDDLPDEQLRSLGLHVVSSLGDELQNVKKAANLDVDSLTGTVVNLGNGFVKARDFLNSDMKTVRAETGFHQILSSFVQTSEIDITRALEEEKRIMVLVRNTSAYFHGHSGKDEGLRLFVIVRDFLIVLDNVCKQVKKSPQKLHRPSKEEEDPVANPSEPRQTRPSIDLQQMIFPVITERRMNESSSEDES